MTTLLDESFTYLEGIPLPSPALVVDVRKNGRDSPILKTLQENLATLYEAMEMGQLHRWKWLRELFVFLPYGVLERSDFQYHPKRMFQQPTAPHGASHANGASGTSSPRYQAALGGKIDTKGTLSYQFFSPDTQNPFHALPPGSFKSRLEEMKRQYTIVVNKRINASTHLNPTGTNSFVDTNNGLTRLFLIADVEEPESLETAATYAAWLQAMNIHAYQDQQGGRTRLAVFVLCLNHENLGKAPRHLVEALQMTAGDSEWPHIDKCIIIEQFDMRGGSLSKQDQERFAQFLLYTLLLAKQDDMLIRAPFPDEDAYRAPHQPQSAASQVKLPAEKFLTVAQASYTYSSHWGRKLLNDSLMQQVLKALTDTSVLDHEDATGEIEQWLREQQQLLEAAMPEQFIRDLPPLQALVSAEETAPLPPKWSLHAAEDAEENITAYAQQLQETYTDTGKGTSLQAVLALLPKIDQYVRGKQEDAGTPLIQVLHHARGMVASERFCKGLPGAVPRAYQQLLALATAVAQRQHAAPAVDVSTAQHALEQSYQQERQELARLRLRFPFFGTRFTPGLQWLTFVVWLIIALAIISVGTDALTQALTKSDIAVLSLLAQTAFVSVSWLVILGGVLAIVLTTLICRMTVFGSESHSPSGSASRQTAGNGAKSRAASNPGASRAAQNSETAFVVALVVLTLFGLIALLPLPFVGPLSVFLFAALRVAALVSLIVVLLVAIVEASLAAQWYRRVREVHQRAIENLQERHYVYIDSLKQAVVNAMLVSLFQRVGVIDAQGQPGPSLATVEQVRAALQKAHNAAQEEVKEAQDHLRYLSEYHSSATISSSLLFHEELLDIKTLTAHLALMQEQIHKLPALETLAQVVLRALGEEKPEQIEQAIETMAPSATLRSQGNLQVRYHRLLALATALLLRGAAGISATPANEKEWLKVRAGRLGSEHRELEAFIHAWEGKMSGKQLDPKQTTTDIALFTMVLTIWVQSWWEQDALFKDLFTPDDVLSRLAERNVNTVKTTLNLRTAFTANPADMGQRIEAFLLAFPAASEEGNHFLSQIVEHYLCVPFPDKNVLSTLWMMHYVTLSDYLDEQGQSLSPPQSFFGRLFSSGSPLLGMPTASSSPSASPNGSGMPAADRTNGTASPSNAQNAGAGRQNDAVTALSATGDQQDGANSLLNTTP